MSTNLVDYFKNQNASSDKKEDSNKKQLPYNDYDDMGPSVSMAVEAENEDDFKKSTFNLKRTRSMGLLDDFIDPTKKPSEKSSDDEADSKLVDDEPASHGTESYYNEDISHYDHLHEQSASVSPPPADNDNYFIPQDDNDVVVEPERHVDYLSHQWKESEISNSWKYIILKKKKRDVDLVNAARLENASWRTWAKARNHLKTVSPEILNWSKDSDVTWLYGPIVRDQHKNKKNKRKENGDIETDSEHEISIGYGSDDETSKRIPSKGKRSVTPKPILKKRSVTEIIEENAQWKLNEARKHINDMKHASVVMDPNGLKDVHDDYDALAARVNAQYYTTPRSRPGSGAPSRENSESNLHNPPRSSSTTPNYAVADSKSFHSDTPINEQSSVKSGSLVTPIQSPNVVASPAQDIVAPQAKQPLSSILSSKYSEKGTGQEQKKSAPSRHIHFNDRVEQCMALRYPSSDSEVDSDYESNSNNLHQTSSVSPSSAPSNNNIRFVRKGEKGQRNQESKIPESPISDDSVSSPSDDNEDEEDYGGLFINARFSRRSDSTVHSPVTDNSSIGSSVTSRTGVRPIIKLLPATTLNYGSDEESETSDIYNYGNAVSHNVNTSRGYDYIYDYNSVYTGDTSSFLPLDHCDIVDVPEGIGLDTSITESDHTGYDINSPLDKRTNIMIPSPTDTPPFLSKASKSPSSYNSSSDSGKSTQLRQNFLSNENHGYSSSDSEQQFIEDSQLNSSDEDEDSEDSDEDDESDDGLTLKRTVTLGKSGTSTSIKDLNMPNEHNADFIPPVKTRSFITGETIDDATREKNNFISNSSSPGIPLKRNQSSKSFIFNSDSNDEDSSDNTSDSASFFGIETPQPVNHQTNATAKSVSGHKNVIPPSNVGPISSIEVSKNFKIPSNTAPDVASSDVAIKGSFSPRYNSVKSVINKEGILSDKSNSPSPQQSSTNIMSKNNFSHSGTGQSFSDNENPDTNKDLSNESLQKMMQSAKNAASKYLNSWKRPENRREDK